MNTNENGRPTTRGPQITYPDGEVGDGHQRESEQVGTTGAAGPMVHDPSEPIIVPQGEGGTTAENEPPYKVGKGRPPKHTRFKPGVSGNPTGLRKQPRNVKQEIQQRFLCRVVVHDGSKKRRIPKIILLVERLLNGGIKGDLKAGLAALKLAVQLGVFDLKQKSTIDFSKLTAEERQAVNRGLEVLKRHHVLEQMF